MGATSGAGTAYPSGAPECTPVFSGVRVNRSLVLCVCFVDRCLSFWTFSFGHCVVYRWFSPAPPVSSTNKIDRHDITEILLKVALNTINQTLSQMTIYMFHLSWALPGHFPFMNYHRVCNHSNRTGDIAGTGTANLSGTPEFILGFSGVSVARSFVFYVVCLSFCLFSFVLSVLLFTDSVYPFDIFKLFLNE
jgi:hypothetical protein